MQLSGNTFLVTGGASGLGQACVERFALAGANVIVADLNDQAGQALADKLGNHVVFAHTDVTNATSVEAALETGVDHFQSLQGVVNCAGVLGASRVVGRSGPHDLDLFTRVIQVNLVGTFNVLRLAATLMSVGDASDDGERGVIINTASVAAFEGQIGQAAYSASKGGVAGMTLPVARELSRFGIRVVSIAPGVFMTPMMQAAPPEVLDSLQQQCLFPTRLGKPEEYAALAQQIIENPMLNGSVIRLDGAVRMAAK